MTPRPFFKGVLDGMTAPFTALRPRLVRTRFDDKMYQSSYRSPEEDRKNIQKDFDRAVAIARTEAVAQSR